LIVDFELLAKEEDECDYPVEVEHVASSSPDFEVL